MKKALVLLIILACNSHAYSQSSEVNLYGFLMKNQELTWQNVYNSDLNKNDLILNIMQFVSSSKINRNIIQSENTIRFDVQGDKIDYEGFGGKWGNTADFVKYPQNYQVIISLSDNQYCVTIKNIEVVLINKMRIADFSLGWHKDYLIDSVSKKRKTEFRQSHSARNGMQLIQKHYYSKFKNLQFKNDVEIE